MHRSRWPLVLGLVLVVVGALGMIAGGALIGIERAARSIDGGSTRDRGGSGDSFDGYESNGQRIYYTGAGRNGAIDREWGVSGRLPGMMGRGRGGLARMGCVICHREDGRGGRAGMMGISAVVPDIRYEKLTSEDASDDAERWTDRDIARAIREGVEPDGKELNELMPRWDMDDEDMSDTIDYLKELSSR